MTEAEILELQQELKAQRLENKKLNRKLMSIESLLERNRRSIAAQESLSAIIKAEKSSMERYMALLMNNCPDIIMLFDKEGRFVNCTEAFLQRAGIRNFGLIGGQSFQEVFARFSGQEWMTHFESAMRQAMDERRTIILEETADFGLNHNPRNYTVYISPMVNEEGQAEGFMALFHDLTDILRAKQQVELASNAKSDFLATVSHEIRTPMNAIMGMTGMLQNTQLSAKQSEYLAGIQNSSRMLLNLINDILDFSKIEAGKLDLLPEYFSLSRLLSSLQAMFEVLFQQKGLSFSCVLDAGLPAVVLGDEKRVGQVLTNLLNNALKYTRQGGATLRVALDEGGLVRFEVEDTGIGIREEDMPRLFRAFEQLDKVKNKKVVGTGLGLAITKRLCTMMGGTVEAKSKEGVGSCFFAALPLPAGTEADLPREQAAGRPFTAPGARVLLVDDIEINLVVAAAMLEQFEIVAVHASGGAEAVALAQMHEFDLIFMDHMMPEMDGVEATQAIRALGGKNAYVPIVALTANAVSGAMEMFLQNDMDGFLPKPLEEAELAACLRKWLPKQLIIEKE